MFKIRGLKEDGTLPSIALNQVRNLIAEAVSKISPKEIDLSDYATIDLVNDIRDSVSKDSSVEITSTASTGVLSAKGPGVKITQPVDDTQAELWSVNPLAQSQNRPISSLDYDPVTNSIFSGFGDWNANGDHVGVVKHDLATGESEIVFDNIYSEAIERVVRLGDWLYVPHIDGKGYWESCGYATDEGGTWHEVTLPGTAIHVFDMAMDSRGLWACGAHLTEDGQGQEIVWHRPTGADWIIHQVGEKGDSARFYSFVKNDEAVEPSKDRLLNNRVTVGNSIYIGAGEGRILRVILEERQTHEVDLLAVNSSGKLDSENVISQISELARQETRNVVGSIFGPLNDSYCAIAVLPTLTFYMRELAYFGKEDYDYETQPNITARLYLYKGMIYLSMEISIPPNVELYKVQDSSRNHQSEFYVPNALFSNANTDNSDLYRVERIGAGYQPYMGATLVYSHENTTRVIYSTLYMDESGYLKGSVRLVGPPSEQPNHFNETFRWPAPIDFDHQNFNWGPDWDPADSGIL